MFTDLLETINIEIVKALSSVNLEQVSAKQKQILEERGREGSPELRQGNASQSRRTVQIQRPKRNLKVGRNDPCPCGSGKKYKQCHG